MNEKHPHNPGNENEPDQQEHPSHEAGQQPSPAIYVASLADYNNGVLHGAWIDAAREPADIQADIDAMLAQSREPNAEEYAIFDYDQFGQCRISRKRPDRPGRADRAWHQGARLRIRRLGEVNEGAPERFDDFTEAYLGHYDSVQDYAEQLVDDLGYTAELAKLPESLRHYLRFDTEALAQDMEQGGDIYPVGSPDGGVWIFRADT